MSLNSTLKPIKIWGIGGPNPPKPVMVCEELGLPYETIFVDIMKGGSKTPEYEAINPNGRVPAIYDPNTDLTLWESGAIMEYLVEKYDTKNLISFPAGSHDAYHAKQYLFYQVSGQGPYYGQAVWFSRYHPEKLESARTRYVNEINRVTGVLEGILAKSKVNEPEGDGPWLVGDRVSYADLAFFPWQAGAAKFLVENGEYDTAKYPNVTKWVKNLGERASVKKAMEGSH